MPTNRRTNATPNAPAASDAARRRVGASCAVTAPTEANTADDETSATARNNDARTPNRASPLKPTSTTIVAVTQSCRSRQPLSPITACAAARRRVVWPATRNSHRPASSSPRKKRVLMRSPHTAPMSITSPTARHAVNPATVSMCRAGPSRAWMPAFAPSSVCTRARSAAVGYAVTKPVVDEKTTIPNTAPHSAAGNDPRRAMKRAITHSG